MSGLEERIKVIENQIVDNKLRAGQNTLSWYNTLDSTSHEKDPISDAKKDSVITVVSTPFDPDQEIMSSNVNDSRKD